MKKTILVLLVLCSWNAFAQVPFQLGNDVQNRKIVLFQAVNNDHQYFGLGINAGMLRYQVDNSNSSHAFFAAASTSTSNELMRITGAGNVGIGTTVPNAPLQFASTEANRKIVMFESGNNNHQYFGFGIGNQLQRYQVGATTSSHAFFAGTSSSTSNELMRITGTGNVGIGSTTPNAQLQLGNTITNRKVVLFEVANNDHQYYGLGVNNQIFRYQVDNTISSHAFYAATSTTASTELMRITGTGNVGIGTTAPNAPLQFASTEANRKIVMFESGNNNHQYFGFGIGNQLQRYQVNATTSSHAFFAGASATTSNELMRITGTGNVGIGSTTPNAQLQLGNTVTNRKVVLFEVANNDHQFYGFGVNSGMLRYQIAGNESGNGHVFYAANTGLASSTELMRIQGNGYVGIGITAPTANLMVVGTPGPTGLVTFNGLNYGSHFFSGATQDTYIRGGKIGSHVYINDDAVIGNVKIGAGGIPTEKLDITGNLKVTGNICYTGTIGACSDLRYKKNFSKIENPLNKVLALNGLHYDWKVEEYKENNFTKDRQIGFIAQEVEKIFPEMVLTDAKGYKSVDYARLTPALVEAIKELKTLNDELKGKNEKLEANGQKIEARLNKIEALLYK